MDWARSGKICKDLLKDPKSLVIHDGLFDFRDPDSDGDFVADGDEDLNGDGHMDGCPSADMCESSRTDTDTDNDGTPDLIERVAGSDPTDPDSNIPEGDFFFVLPYRDPVRYRGVLGVGMAACVLVVPLALICGPIRGIPFYWQLIDCSFGVFCIFPLWYALRLSKRIEAGAG